MRFSKSLFWLTPPILALTLYGSTLTLPFFWDDVPHFQYLHNRSIPSIWSDASISPYYRPLTFTVWRVMQLVVGSTNPAPYHFVNVLALIVNGWLVGLLAKCLVQFSEVSETSENSDLVGWLAGALLVVFPFAAQLVPWVAALSHLLVTLLTVGACVCILEYEKNSRPGWAIAAVALAALAPFASEAGLITSGLMTTCIAIRRLHTKPFSFEQTGLRPLLLVIALSFLLNLAYLPLWAQVPKDRPAGALVWVGWESVWQTIIFFFEGLTFPIQFLARPLMALGLADLWAVAALGLIALALTWVVLQDRRWLVFSLVYCFIAALPATISLPFSYVIVSPRLMMITAPAAAILWAMGIAGGTRRLTRPGIRIGVAAIAVATVSSVPALHISREVHLHHLALDHLHAFVANLQSHPNDKTLIVNAVNWTAPVQADYALGHEGVEVMPGYLTPQLMAWVHTQTLYDVDAVTFSLIFPELKTIYFSTWGEALDWNAMAERVRAADHVAVIRYTDDGVEYNDVGNVAPASGEVIVSFEDRIGLTGMEAKVVPGAIELRLDWRVNAASGEDIFANALDCSGNVAGLSGGAGLGGIYPVWLWQPGESIHEVRRIQLETPSPDGCYRIEIGLFGPQTGQRTPAFGANDQRLENDVVRINLPAR